MTNEFITKLTDSGKSSFETFQQFNVINVETMKKLAALQFNLTNLNVESAVAQAKLLSSGSAPEELFAAESALANTYREKLMQITNETTELMTSSREQLAAFTEKSFKAVEPSASKAAAKQSKKAVAKKTTKKAVTKKVAKKASAKKVTKKAA